jgi:creatinine amidohydrolase
MNVVEDIVHSLHGVGFQRFLILNGHGGNEGVKIRLVEMQNQMADLKFGFYSWWLSDSVKRIADKYGLPRAHANWMEAFPYTKSGDLPTNEKPLLQPDFLHCANELRSYLGDGSYGGSYEVKDAIMDEIFDACLHDVCRLLEFSKE